MSFRDYWLHADVVEGGIAAGWIPEPSLASVTDHLFAASLTAGHPRLLHLDEAHRESCRWGQNPDELARNAEDLQNVDLAELSPEVLLSVVWQQDWFAAVKWAPAKSAVPGPCRATEPAQSVAELPRGPTATRPLHQ